MCKKYVVSETRRIAWPFRPVKLYVICVGDTRAVYRLFVGRSEVMRPLARSRRRCEDNIKKNFKETGWDECTGLIWLMSGTGGRIL